MREIQNSLALFELVDREEGAVLLADEAEEVIV